MKCAFLINWRTSLWGSLAAIAFYLKDNPGDLQAVLDPADAKRVIGLVGLFCGILTALNMKDRQVCGNGTLDDPHRVADSQTGTSRLLSLLIAGFLLVGTAAGCASTKCGYWKWARSTDRTYTLAAEQDGEIRRVEASAHFAPAK